MEASAPVRDLPATERVRIGLMVGANPFRNPALVAKMVL